MKYILSLGVLFSIAFPAFSQLGVIQGVVKDKISGEPMFGVNVYLEGSTIGSSTDFDGHYTINNVVPGEYTVVGSFITYAINKHANVVIASNETVILNFDMEASATDIAEVVISVRASTKSENSVLAMQKKSVALQDGLSSEEMIKTGAINAAESAKQITGTSVVDGKYVYVRGLGDRYTISQLNGASLISTDPYINSAPLDLIPSNLLANIVTIKTATPDQPGNFSGGIVNLSTKGVPEKMTLNYSNSISYNHQSSFNSNFLSQSKGKYDWLGYDDGSRSLPLILQSEENLNLLSSPVFYIQARSNDEYATLLDDASNSLNRQMSPNTDRSFTNYSTSFAFGNQYQLFGNNLGVNLGLNHSKSYSNYENGTNQAWDITSAEADELFTYYDLTDNKSVDNPIVSGIASVSYQIGENNEIGVLSIYNHDTEKMSRYQSGVIPGIVSGGDKVFETRTIQFKERGLKTTQIKGKHLFESYNNIELEWITAFTNSFQDEPDLRFFANEKVGDSLYYISVSEYDLPYHYFRYLNDKAFESKVDITIPLSKEPFSSNKIKLGARTNKKARDFTEYRFYYKNQNAENYAGDQGAFFGPQNTGVIGYDSLNGNWNIGNYLVNNSKISNNYLGNQNITALYAMGVFNIFDKLKFSGGVRMEKTNMHVESADTTEKKGDINQVNFFNSMNLIYSLDDKTNIRGSYSQTIARPSMRELAPFVTFDFIGGFLYLGNPELKTTLINNYDLRWEHFINPGEVFAVSGYYKHFIDPIVKAYNTEAINPEIIYQNTNEADVYGLEFDFRKNLSFISPRLKDFKLNTNFSYIISRVALDTSEYLVLAEINPEITAYRPFQGQSPFLFNSVLSYFSEVNQFGADINYNVYGKRLSAIGLKGLPDIYDMPVGMLNVSFYKNFRSNINLKFRVNNLLNAEYSSIQTFKNNAYTNSSHRIGTSYSLSVSYSI